MVWRNGANVWEDPHWDVEVCGSCWRAWAAPGYGGPPGCMGPKDLWDVKGMAAGYGVVD